MKKMRFIFVAICFMALAGIVIFQSCKKNDSIDDPIVETYVLTEPNTFEDLFVFPVGTVLTLKTNQINYQLPEGFQLVMSLYDNTVPGNATSQIIVKSSGSITCKCLNGTGGCSPYVQGKKSGCLMDEGCSLCEKKVNELKSSLEILEATIVDLNIPPRFITDLEEIKTIPSPSSLMFESNEVMEKLENFLSGFNDDLERLKNISIENIPEDYAYVPVRFLGKLILAPVLKSRCLSANFKSMTVANKDKYSCTCGAGSGCVYARNKILGIHYCNAGTCTECTMAEL